MSNETETPEQYVWVIRYWPLANPHDTRFVTRADGNFIDVYGNKDDASRRMDSLSSQHGMIYGYHVEGQALSGGVPWQQAMVLTAQAEVRRLEALVETARNETRVARAHHEADIALIGERLIDEANEREWCSEYDNIVDDLNERLHVELPTRTWEYEVIVRCTIDVPVKVNARSEDDAIESATCEMHAEDDDVRNALNTVSAHIEEAVRVRRT